MAKKPRSTRSRRQRNADGVRLANNGRKNRRRANSRQSEATRKKNTQGLIIIIAVLGIAAMLTAYSVRAESQRVTFDENSCPTNRDLAENTIYLIDGTDQLPPAATGYLERDIARHAQEMPQFGKLTVLKLGGDADSLDLKVLFSACNRGRGDDFNPLTVNQKRQDTLRESEFVSPLSESIKALGSLEEGDRSPIIEALREIGRRQDMEGAYPKDLIIVSDMMHHTQDFSQYTLGYTFESVAVKSEFSIVSKLTAVDVKVIYVLRRRLSGLQSQRHRDFWSDYLEGSGAFVEFERP